MNLAASQTVLGLELHSAGILWSVHRGLTAAPAQSQFPDSQLPLSSLGEDETLWRARNHGPCPGPSLPAGSTRSSAEGGGAHGQSHPGV